MFQQYKNKFFKTQLGLQPIIEDKRDLGAFNFWGLFDLGYDAKHNKKVIPHPFAAKSQFYNTCGWTGEAGMKEIDEKVELSPRSFVLAGKSLGYISGDGFSNLRNNEKTLQKIGIAEKNVLVEGHTDWYDYSNLKYFTDQVKENAGKHRSKSYLRLYRPQEIYKAIDEDRPVSIGIDWYSGFNIGNGFSAPWIINGPKGYRIGGHKMFVYGYDNIKKLFKVRNSFGPTWGDNGDLYITENFLGEQVGKYGAFINYDMELTITEWVIENKNTLVRTPEKSTVYFIQDGKKRPFLSMKDLETFLRLVPIFHYPLIPKDINYIDSKILDQVPLGRDMLK